MKRIKNLWYLLTTPRATDEDEARQEYMTRVILTLTADVLGISIVFAIIAHLIRILPLQHLFIVIVANLVVWGSLFLAHIGRWRLASNIVIIGFFLNAVFDNYAMGIGSPAMLSYVVAMVISLMLEGKRRTWLVLIASIAAYLTIGLGHIQGTLPAPPVSVPRGVFGKWAIDVIFSFVVISLLLWFFSKQLQKSLAKSREYAAELAERQRVSEQQALEIQKLAESDKEARGELEQMLKKYDEFAQRVAQGDLRAHLNVMATTDIGRLGRRLNGMVASLNELALQTIKSAQNVATVSSEIMASTGQQATSAQEQAAAVAQTTTTLSEIKSVAEEMTRRAQGTSDLATQTAEISQTGTQAVQAAVNGMNNIQSRVAELAEIISELSEQTQQIDEIITAVDQIAAQSQMLALNAAVEAARAGEAGQGFGVVATEVRALAERSKIATGRVRGIIQQIQRSTNTAVETTNEVGKSVLQGEKLTSQAGDVIIKLEDQNRDAVQAAVQIVASAQQQVGGLEQVTDAMSNINAATQQTVDSVRQTEQAAKDLNELAQQMTRLVERYQV